MLPEGSRLAMAEAFAHLLGNTCSLQMATLCCEWNVRGPFAAPAASLFHRQSVEMFRALTPIAHRIRHIGGIARPDEGDQVFTVSDQTASLANSDAAALARLLSDGHRKMIISIQAAADVAAELDDRGSLMVLDTRLLAHEQHLAQLADFGP